MDHVPVVAACLANGGRDLVWGEAGQSGDIGRPGRRHVGHVGPRPPPRTKAAQVDSASLRANPTPLVASGPVVVVAVVAGVALAIVVGVLAISATGGGGVMGVAAGHALGLLGGGVRVVLGVGEPGRVLRLPDQLTPVGADGRDEGATKGLGVGGDPADNPAAASAN